MPSAEAATVWLDDTHAIFRRGMAACLSSDGFRVVGESAAFSPFPPSGGVDVLVFEAEDRGLQRAVQFATQTGVRLVAVVRQPTEALLGDAVEVGVHAVVLFADVNPRSLVSSVRAVLSGHTALPRDVLPRLLERATKGAHHAAGSLTPRELQVLKLLADGEDTRGIADELSYSERTVKNVVHDVLAKMNCRNRAHAVALATRQGVI